MRRRNGSAGSVTVGSLPLPAAVSGALLLAVLGVSQGGTGVTQAKG